jgi:hypothetical protein
MRARRNFVIAVLSVFVLAVGSGATAIAQEKETAPAPKLEQKVLIDNDRVKVVENSFKPGAQSESIARPYRVVRANEQPRSKLRGILKQRELMI